jgi:hypothetical protein
VTFGVQRPMAYTAGMASAAGAGVARRHCATLWLVQRAWASVRPWQTASCVVGCNSCSRACSSAALR